MPCNKTTFFINPEFELIGEGCPNHQGIEDEPALVPDDPASEHGSRGDDGRDANLIGS